MVLRAVERRLRVDATEVLPLLGKSFRFFGLPSFVLVSRTRLTVFQFAYVWVAYAGVLFSPYPSSHPLVPWSLLFDRRPFTAWHMVNHCSLAFKWLHQWDGELHRKNK